MSSQTQLLDDTALTPILFLAIYLYVRVTVVWIVGLSSRYADRAAHTRPELPTEGINQWPPEPASIPSTDRPGLGKLDHLRRH